MKIVTWNVNSVRARADRLLNWIEAHEPDVLCLQEIKTTGVGFPFEALEDLGYYAELHGQKSYNGVAIISREPLEAVVRNMDDGVADDQARLMAATTNGVRVVCVYVPNGGALDSDKWPYKLAWYERLRRWLEAHEDPAQPLALCGDFNVAPADIDLQQPANWTGGVLCDPKARGALERVMEWGLTDSFRALHPQAAAYSWWDYRRRGMAGRDGLRIDFVLPTASLVARLQAAGVDTEERKAVGGYEKPSDHAPVWAQFADE